MREQRATGVFWQAVATWLTLRCNQMEPLPFISRGYPCCWPLSGWFFGNWGKVYENSKSLLLRELSIWYDYEFAKRSSESYPKWLSYLCSSLWKNLTHFKLDNTKFSNTKILKTINEAFGDHRFDLISPKWDQ